MKKPAQSRYMEISFFTAATAVVISAVFLIMNNIDHIFNFVKGLVIWTLGLFTPLYTALIIAFILDPVVELFQNSTKKNKKEEFKTRVRGTLVTYIIVALIFILIIKLCISSFGPKEVGDISAVIEMFVEDMKEIAFGIKDILDDTGLFSNTDVVFDSIIERFSYFSQKFVFEAALSLSQVIKRIFDIFIGAVAGFYFLSEKEKLLYRFDDTCRTFMPLKIYNYLKACTKDINGIFSGYVSGQIIDAFIMTVLISIAMYFIGVDYFLIIGIISGILNLIPYFGAITAFILSVAVSATQGESLKILYTAIAVFVIQQIDSMVLVPKVVGSKVKLHPVLVIISLSVFGSMFGIWGMIIAVPVTAFIKKRFDNVYSRKRQDT